MGVRALLLIKIYKEGKINIFSIVDLVDYELTPGHCLHCYLFDDKLSVGDAAHGGCFSTG